MNDDAMLVAMRLRDAPYRHPEEDNSRSCSVCHEQVCLFPTSQGLLRRVPNMAIICLVCAKVLPDHEMVTAARTPAELREEMRTLSRRTTRKGPNADIAR